jgi:hypothetical protein
MWQRPQPPSAEQDSAAAVTARAAEPKALATEVHACSLKAHGCNMHLFAVITPLRCDLDLQHVTCRVRWILAPQRCEIDPMHDFRQRSPAYTPHS